MAKRRKTKSVAYSYTELFGITRDGAERWQSLPDHFFVTAILLSERPALFTDEEVGLLVEIGQAPELSDNQRAALDAFALRFRVDDAMDGVLREVAGRV